MKQVVLDFTKPIKDIEISEDTEILGLFVGHDVENFTGKFNIVHKAPGWKSRTRIKAVLYENSRFDLAPIVKIIKGAKFTDAYLKVDVLLIGAGARARAVPSLEITENDVKGGHGATIGKLDKDQLFYLMSRGLSKAEAEELLIKAFISDIMNAITITPEAV